FCFVSFFDVYHYLQTTDPISKRSNHVFEGVALVLENITHNRESLVRDHLSSLMVMFLGCFKQLLSKLFFTAIDKLFFLKRTFYSKVFDALKCKSFKIFKRLVLFYNICS